MSSSSGRDSVWKKRLSSERITDTSQIFSNPMRSRRGDELLAIFNREKAALEEKRANMARERAAELPPRESDKNDYRYRRRLTAHYGDKISDDDKERRRELLGNYNARTEKAKQRASESYKKSGKSGLSIQEKKTFPVQYLILDPQNSPNVEKLPPGPVHFGGKKRKTTKKRKISPTRKIKRRKIYKKKSIRRRMRI